MKKFEMATEVYCGKIKQASLPQPPPPPPPSTRVAGSITNQEIARFWRQKRIEKEDHLLAAIKAAARIRARNLKEDEYKLFLESLKDQDDDNINSSDIPSSQSDKNNANEEIRVGIKDWWTKSNYAYLNQPVIESVDASRKRKSNYTPNYCFFKPTSLHPTSMSVF